MSQYRVTHPGSREEFVTEPSDELVPLGVGYHISNPGIEPEIAADVVAQYRAKHGTIQSVHPYQVSLDSEASSKAPEPATPAAPEPTTPETPAETDKAPEPTGPAVDIELIASVLGDMNDTAMKALGDALERAHVPFNHDGRWGRTTRINAILDAGFTTDQLDACTPKE